MRGQPVCIPFRGARDIYDLEHLGNVARQHAHLLLCIKTRVCSAKQCKKAVHCGQSAGLPKHPTKATHSLFLCVAIQCYQQSNAGQLYSEVSWFN